MKRGPLRPRYDNGQISQYFEMIQLPEQHQKTRSLDSLTALLQRHLCHVPFENLSIHYSPHHHVSLDPDLLFDKIVAREAGRGGYCMENNSFFGTMLRSLGYDLVPVGARVHEGVTSPGRDTYLGFSHMVNLVWSDGVPYLVDVGFGGDGPIRPLPLYPGHVSAGIGEQQLRLVKNNILDNSDSSQSLWIYETRYTTNEPWKPIYCFTELEFLPQDYEIMNYYTSTSRTSWFTQVIVVVKMIMEQEEIVGTVSMLNGGVKRRIKGKSEVVADCKSEEARVETLKEIFQIILDAIEIKGIKGYVTQLET